MAGSGQRRFRFVARGQVQGVGFRPFVFSLAREYALTGFVRNSPRGVVIEAQGREAALTAFARDLECRLPPLARLTGLEREECALLSGESAFAISRSSAGTSHTVLISPDVCICSDCLAEMADADDRRFRYPFTNCTNCGPRYSITRSVPYDRQATSMACFPLCPNCEAEYNTPGNRRFHAQPNACPACGPEVWLVEKQRGKTIRGDAALRALAGVLAGGGIAAIKGLGGFHLACDAGNDRAVSALRLHKNRPHKPFAVMAAGLEDVRRVAVLGLEAEALLSSPERPAVICSLLPGASGTSISSLISPDTSTIGLMLPYTPLHRVLLDYFAAATRQDQSDPVAVRPAILVMTSGNPGGKPICLGNREALASLGGMADVLLFHNRDILVRVDDSVVRPLPGRSPLFYRRARGYVPRPVALDVLTGGTPEVSPPVVLGVGAELKNTLCLTKGEDAFVSQHIGDMSTMETAAFHLEIRERLLALLKIRPEAVVRDRHPDYLSSDLADKLAAEAGIPLLRLQHHFAHAHAVLAEHRHRKPALVLALDGTGLGEDGGLWGGEVLYVDSSGTGPPRHERLACFVPLALPGGEAAIREPWRIAHALLLRLGLLPDDSGMAFGPLPDTTSFTAPSGASCPDTPHFILPWLPEHAATARLLPRMLEKGFNTPWSTSCGRLCDAVSALLGLCNAITYEGQAAIRLEEAQGPDAAFGGTVDAYRYPCPFGLTGRTDPSSGKNPGVVQLDTLSLFSAVYADRLRGTPVPIIARRFHLSLAEALAELTGHLAQNRGISHVGLSGGCFQNIALTLSLAASLEKKGLVPLLHKDLPPGDGCISLGQAVWGRLALHAGRQSSGTR